MDIVATWSQLGVGLASIMTLYLVVMKGIEALNQRDQAFREYVEANNHKSVEVMTQCRDAIEAATQNMKTSALIQERILQEMIINKRD